LSIKASPTDEIILTAAKFDHLAHDPRLRFLRELFSRRRKSIGHKLAGTFWQKLGWQNLLPPPLSGPRFRKRFAFFVSGASASARPLASFLERSRNFRCVSASSSLSFEAFTFSGAIVPFLRLKFNAGLAAVREYAGGFEDGHDSVHRLDIRGDGADGSLRAF
jgi:hypothetical protein